MSLRAKDNMNSSTAPALLLPVVVGTVPASLSRTKLWRARFELEGGSKSECGSRSGSDYDPSYGGPRHRGGDKYLGTTSSGLQGPSLAEWNEIWRPQNCDGGRRSVRVPRVLTPDYQVRDSDS